MGTRHLERHVLSPLLSPERVSILVQGEGKGGVEESRGKETEEGKGDEENVRRIRRRKKNGNGKENAKKAKKKV